MCCQSSQQCQGPGPACELKSLQRVALGSQARSQQLLTGAKGHLTSPQRLSRPLFAERLLPASPGLSSEALHKAGQRDLPSSPSPNCLPSSPWQPAFPVWPQEKKPLPRQPSSLTLSHLRLIVSTHFLSRVCVPGIHMRSTPTRTAWRCSNKTCRVNAQVSLKAPHPQATPVQPPAQRNHTSPPQPDANHSGLGPSCLLRELT